MNYTNLENNTEKTKNIKNVNLTKKQLIETINVINYKLDIICEYIFLNKFNNQSSLCEILTESDFIYGSNK